MLHLLGCLHLFEQIPTQGQGNFYSQSVTRVSLGGGGGGGGTILCSHCIVDILVTIIKFGEI